MGDVLQSSEPTPCRSPRTPTLLNTSQRSPDGSFTAAHYLRSGKFDLLKYEDGRLVECDYVGSPKSSLHMS